MSASDEPQHQDARTAAATSSPAASSSRRVIFPAPGKVVVERRAVPAPGPGQALVRISLSAISPGTETTVLHQRFEPGTHWDRWVRYPFEPGYSAVGRVSDVGPGASPEWVGQRVAVRCAHGDHAVASVDRLTPIPDGLDDADAAWFALATIAQAAVRRGRPVLGERVLVVGLGPLGRLITQYCELIGAREVVAVDPHVSGEGAGAPTVRWVEGRLGEPALRDALPPRRFDLAFDATGSAEALAAIVPHLQTSGRLVLVGDSGYPSHRRLHGDLLRCSIDLIGVHDGTIPDVSESAAEWTRPRMAALFFDYLADGRMSVRPLGVQQFAGDRAPMAYDQLASTPARHRGVVLDWR